MKNFDNFDDLVKKKMDGMDFPFNEANWEKASQMLDATRPSKRPIGKFWITTSVIGGSLLIIGITALLWMNQTNDSTIISATTSSETKNMLTETTSKIPAQEATSFEDNSAKGSNSSSNAPENTYVTDSHNNVTNTKKQNVIQTLTSQNLVSMAAQKTAPTPLDEAKHAQPEQNNSGTATIDQSGNDKTGGTQMIVGSVENAKFKDKESNEQKVLIENTSKSNTSVYKPLESFSTSVSSTNTNSVSEQTSSTGNTSDVLAAEVKPDSSAATANVALQPDTTMNDTKRRDYVKTKHHEITVEAGAMNSFGWKVNNIRNGNNISPIGGINYIYHFNHRSAISAGLQYNALSNLTESNVSYSVTTYDFGVNNDVTTYKVIGLQYLVMPLRYIHHINQDNSIGVGINCMYLMNIQNKIESFTAIENNIKNTSIASDNGYGYNVVNNYNAQFAINYQRKLSKQLGFSMEVNRNLMNVFSNYTFFGSECNTSKPITAKISLTYTLLRK